MNYTTRLLRAIWVVGSKSRKVRMAVGVLAVGALAWGVRLALREPPQDDAIRNVREIAEAAKAHYERTGELCASAVSVPAAMFDVQGKAYAPRDTADTDFNAGNFDGGVGWYCLGWKPSQASIRYQMNYFVGSGYLGHAAGGPDPTASGFEAAAMG